MSDSVKRSIARTYEKDVELNIEDYKRIAFIINETYHSIENNEQFFPQSVKELVYHPVDNLIKSQSPRENLRRMIQIQMSKNDWYSALDVFNYYIKNYSTPLTFIWRVGFALIMRIGKYESVKEFYKGLLQIGFVDTSTMILNYYNYLTAKEEFQEIYNDFENLPKHIFYSVPGSVEKDRELININIRLVAARAYYLEWKRSKQMLNTDYVKAEHLYKQIYELIKKSDEYPDFHVHNYCSLLVDLDRISEALELLNYYCEVRPHPGSKQLLLDFRVKYKDCIHDDDYEDEMDLLDRKIEFIKLNTDGVSPRHTHDCRILEEVVEKLFSLDRFEEMVMILLVLIVDKKWIYIEWPWIYLWKGIHKLQPLSMEIKQIITDRKRVWKRYRSCTNEYFNLCKNFQPDL